MRYTLGIVLLMLCTMATYAEQPTAIPNDTGGEVRLPRDVYNTMLEKAKEAVEKAEKDVISFAFGKARLMVNILEENDRMTGYVEARVPVSTYTDEWTSIPLLSSNTALTLVSINQQSAQLADIGGQFVWQTSQQGEHIITLAYVVDTTVKNGRNILEIPIPNASSIVLEASIPNTKIDAKISPAVGVSVSELYDRTQLKAHLTPNKQPTLSWSIPTGASNYSISRAIYKVKKIKN